MSSLSHTRKKYSKKTVSISAALLLTTMVLSATGCNTTQEFKPTASVMVGAHKSL
ncbi:hypothetical protein ACT3TI_00030 [Psychrobacter sp. AOP22-C1-22]|uniref:hypothetical protein n=1 Tax=unclassified Psychrobacter TaxID=196806 RepID=UPI001787E837|nr:MULTISPECIES: hypothetical protein [unclassified Psychrobacter]MDN5800886.1 hypothetical protein [Psychrobacter sp.]MBE0407066.1 hypothetical protein [Psychrobacter sp. FME6]MBE0445063.1 hypothetical protein [Psychrobacter sp. FME5]MDN5891038.1 hypothetical protein [Psychrobacter sp.]MDN5897959.1 hypothetical protein [Psychrobacter sp.]